MKKPPRRHSDLNLYAVFEVWESFYHKGDALWLHKYKQPFAEYLGGFEGHLDVLSTWELTAEGERRARMLLGPHARTIVKAYFIQHPELPKPPLL